MSFRSLQGPGRNNDPEPFSDLRERLASLKRQIDDLSGSILRSAGLKAEPDLLRILGSLVIEGDLAVPNGSITNDALENPVGSAGAKADEWGFGVGTTPTNRAVASLTVPAGFASALVFSNAAVSTQNSSAVGDYLFIRSRIAAVDSDSMPYRATAGVWVSGTMVGLQILTGLTGGQTIALTCRINSQEGAWSAHTSNRAFTSGIGLFFR